MKNKIGSISTYLGVLIMLAFGTIYLLKNSFMPFHSEALGLEWSEVDNSTQSIILALMRTASGGLLAGSLVVIVLQMKFAIHKLTWIPGLILGVGTLIGLTAIYATLIIRMNTPGTPPTGLVVAGIVLFLIGYIFNRKALQALSE